MNKGHNPRPKVGGIDALDVNTSQADIPSAYFAGTRKLDGFGLMTPLISKVTNASGGKGK